MTDTVSTDDLKYWRDVLNGNSPDVTEDPECGYYRAPWGKKVGDSREMIPIAIWKADGEVRCLVGYKADTGKYPSAYFMELSELQRFWTYFCTNAVDYNTYKQVFDTGFPWPEEAVVEEEPGPGHNEPPKEGIELHKHNFEMLAAAVKEHLAVEESKRDKVWGDKASNYRNKITALKKDVDGERKELKKPHDDAGAAIQEVYQPVVNDIEGLNKLCRAELAKFKTAQDKEAKKQLLAEAKAVDAGEKTLEEVVIPKEIKNVGGKKTTGERATAFPDKRTAEITNYKKALEHFEQHEMVVNLVQSLCDREARTGADKGPGWKVKITKDAR